MGIVFHAEDITLKRSVALKFLRGTSLSQEQLRARFRREARTAAALNHPNVCTIHEVGEVRKNEEHALGTDERLEVGTPFIAMELVEGRTLATMVRQRGSLPFDDLLGIALQVVEGMAAAHARGIVHRDLKPGNVMVTNEGRVKILDFGLAKPLVRAAPSPAEGTATESVSAELTREGVVIGTAAYMSPEQAKGEPVDSRSDVFSFGVMLYELATGARPFRGTTMISTLAKIVEAEPEPIPDSRADIPLELRRIIRRCLQKKPEGRYNDTRDLVAALKALRQDTTSEGPRIAGGAAGVASARSALRRTALWAAAAGALAVVVALVLLAQQPILWRPNAGPPIHRQITFTTTAEEPALSPDGETVVFVERAYGLEPRLLVQDLAGGEPHEIHRGNVEQVRWSPDGSKVLFIERDAERRRAMFVVPRLGGSPSRVDVPLLTGARWRAAWSPDGNRVAVAYEGGNKIAIVDLATGRSETLSAGVDVTFIVDLDWSPRGDLLCACTESATERRIRVVPLRGSTETLFRGGTSNFGWLARWAPAGDAIYYLRGSGGTTLDLWRVPVDPSTGRATGSSIAVLAGLPLSGDVSLSADGTRLAYGREDLSTNLWLVEIGSIRSGEAVRVRSLTTGTSLVERPRISPDGRRVAYASGTKVSANIWTTGFEGGSPQQLTFLDGFNSAPAWSPEGDLIAFASNRRDSHQIQVVRATGGTPMPLQSTPWSTGPVTAWSPGSAIIWHCLENQDFCVKNLEGGERFLLEGARTGFVFNPAPAPDGRRIAFRWNRPDAPGPWIAPLDGGDPQPLAGRPGLCPLGWSQDGRFVFAMDIDVSPLRVVKIAVATRSVEPLFELPFDVDTDHPGSSDPTGTRFVFTRVDRKSDVWVVENFDAGR